MSLPLAITGGSELPKADEHRRSRKSISGLRILLAEDVEMVRDLITILLSREGVTVTAVTDGAAALVAATAEAFDIILLDVHMPVMSGLEATKRIRDSAGPCARVPILALTANTLRRDIEKCRAAGMDGHVPKPFSPEALINAIMSVLDDG